MGSNPISGSLPLSLLSPPLASRSPGLASPPPGTVSLLLESAAMRSLRSLLVSGLAALRARGRRRPGCGGAGLARTPRRRPVAQRQPHRSARSPALDRGDHVRPGVVVLILMIVVSYMRYAPRFSRDEEQLKVVRADRVRLGQELPRRAVDISQAVPVVVAPPAVPVGHARRRSGSPPLRAAAPAAAAAGRSGARAPHRAADARRSRRGSRTRPPTPAARPHLPHAAAAEERPEVSARRGGLPADARRAAGEGHRAAGSPRGRPGAPP